MDVKEFRNIIENKYPHIHREVMHKNDISLINTFYNADIIELDITVSSEDLEKYDSTLNPDSFLIRIYKKVYYINGLKRIKNLQEKKTYKLCIRI